MSRRIDRLSAQLKREIAALIRTRVKDPRVGVVTVTHVRVDSDLTHARVFIRLPGGEADRASAMEGLGAAAPFLRRELGTVLKIRRAPELVFQEDDSLDQAMRIEELLREVRPEDGWEEPRDDDDPTPGGDDDDPTPGGDEA
jgi:ribosome-binding factor A